MILVFGSINVDLVARVHSIPRPGETILARGYERFFGGKGANQAVAAARAARGGQLRVGMAGAVGNDAFGAESVTNLQANAVDTSGVQLVAEPTGCAFITVDAGGENAITVASGANMHVRAHAVPDELLAEATILVLQMEVPVEESLAVARRARERGSRIIWNLAPMPPAMPRDLFRSVLSATDILVANELEASEASHQLDHGTSDHRQAGATIARECELTVIVTAGAHGAAAFMADGTIAQASALPIEPVDTTGAGDTFVGVVAASLAEGLALPVTLTRACKGASLACLRLGAQAAMPFRDQL